MESYSVVLPVPVPAVFFMQNNLIKFIFHSTALKLIFSYDFLALPKSIIFQNL